MGHSLSQLFWVELRDHLRFFFGVWGIVFVGFFAQNSLNLNSREGLLLGGLFLVVLISQWKWKRFSWKLKFAFSSSTLLRGLFFLWVILGFLLLAYIGVYLVQKAQQISSIGYAWSLGVIWLGGTFFLISKHSSSIGVLWHAFLVGVAALFLFYCVKATLRVAVSLKEVRSLVYLRTLLLCWVVCSFPLLYRYTEFMQVLWLSSLLVASALIAFYAYQFFREIPIRVPSFKPVQVLGSTSLFLSAFLYYYVSGARTMPKIRAPSWSAPSSFVSQEKPLEEAYYLEKRKVGFSCEALYLKAIEDLLVYGQKIPQVPTYEPVIHRVEQPFQYDVGVRANLDVPVFYDDWKVLASWMVFVAHPKPVYEYDENYGILANYAVPIVGSNGNSLVKEVSGKWGLTLNTAALEVQKVIDCHEKLALSLGIGTRFGWLKQTTEVKYAQFRVVSTSNDTPQKVIGKNEFIGLGPTVSLKALFRLPHNLGFFLGAGYSGMLGDFHLNTTYSNLLNTNDGKIVVKDSLKRIVPYGQIQVGLSKAWVLQKNTQFELMLGWEQEVWWDQMRMNWFSNLVSQPDGADLTLHGLFLKSKINF